MSEQIAAGENIVSYCTKCKLGLDHAVVALVKEKVAKVKCKTCGSVHKYRDPAAPPPKKRVTKAKTGAASQSPVARWEESIAVAKGREHEYSMVGKYRVGDIVNHDRFGKGIVTKLHSNKCDVLFQDKERLMASSN